MKIYISLHVHNVFVDSGNIHSELAKSYSNPTWNHMYMCYNMVT